MPTDNDGITLIRNPDPNRRPTDDYVLTYNCINHVENLTSFNDGYHVIHHINSRVHWSDMPQRFLDWLPQHAEKESINFVGLHFMQVGLYVMTGQLETLAESYLQLSDKPKSKEDIVKMFKERLVPIHMTDKEKMALKNK